MARLPEVGDQWTEYEPVKLLSVATMWNGSMPCIGFVIEVDSFHYSAAMYYNARDNGAHQMLLAALYLLQRTGDDVSIRGDWQSYENISDINVRIVGPYLRIRAVKTSYGEWF